MTVQDSREVNHDPSPTFERRHTEPAGELWNGKYVVPQPVQKSYSYHVNPLNLQHHSDSAASMCVSSGKEKHPNSARTVYKKLGGKEVPLDYAKKESSINRSIQKLLLKEVKANDDHTHDVADYEEAFTRMCYEAVDEVFSREADAPVTELHRLVDASIEEAQKRIFSYGMLLSPIREKLLLLHKTAENYLNNEVKKRTSWTDELLTELSLILEYLNPERKPVKGENRIQFFLDFLEKKVKDSVICGIICKAVVPAKMRMSKFTQFFRDLKTESVRDIVHAYYYKRIELMQKSSVPIEWAEDESSCCKLNKINRSGMASSLLRDFANTQSMIAVNGKVIDVSSILDLPSHEEQLEVFFTKIAESILKDPEDVSNAVNSLLEQQPTVIDPILWSCCFHAWSNPEVLLQEKFMPLSQKGHCVIKGPATDCKIDVKDDLSFFNVHIAKEFCIYPTDEKTGIKDVTQPILRFVCYWHYRPQATEEESKWLGTMKFEKLHFVEGVPLFHRENVETSLLTVFGC